MNDRPQTKVLSFKDRLEQYCHELVDRGILFPEAMEQFERCFIAEVLRRNNGSLIRTAAILGMHRNTLAKKISHWKE